MLKPEVLHLTVVGALLLATSANGDTISTWVGGTPPADWSTAANWAPPTVPNNSPGTGYDVTIGSSGTVALDISPTINSLALSGILIALPGAAPQLTVVNDANVTNGALVFGATILQPPPNGPGSLSVGGDLSLGSHTLVVVNGSLTVSGSFTNAAPIIQLYSTTGTETFTVGGTATNQAGSVFLLGGGRCFNLEGCNGPDPGFAPTPVNGPTTSVGALVNNGTIYSWSDISSATLVNHGSFSQISGSASAGTLQNGGTIYLNNSSGSQGLEPTAGLNVGTGARGIGYNQSATGILDELLLGNSTYGTIIGQQPPVAPRNMGYGASLNGTLDIMLQNGFVPTFGESFTIITVAPGDISGMFSNVESDSFENGNQLGYFVVSYDNAAGEVIITAEPVPEPATAFLVIPVLLFVAWCWRRRGAVHAF